MPLWDVLSLNYFWIQNSIGNALRLVLICGCLGLLFGCASYGPAFTKKSDKSLDSYTTLENIRLGEVNYAVWRKLGDLRALKLAERHFAQARTEALDNIALQKAYYSVLYPLAYHLNGAWLDKAEKFYASMSPLARQNLNPPMLIRYAKLASEEGRDAEKIELLQQALSQQPASANIWNMLSIQYQGQEQPELALFAALKAVDLEPQFPESFYQATLVYEDFIYRGECIYDDEYYRERALELISQAVLQQPNNTDYLIELARLYLSLGVYPMAWHAATRSHDLAPSEASLDILAHSQFALGQVDAAGKSLTELKRRYQAQWVESSLAATDIANNQWQQAEKHMRLMMRSKFADLYNGLFYLWLRNIVEPSRTPVFSFDLGDFNTPQMDSQMVWLQQINRYVSSPNQPMEALVHAAKNTCQLTEAHFITAMKYWLAKDSNQSQFHLHQVLELKAYEYQEYLWAQALLQSDLFQH